jgi:hypothetical protein
MIINVAGVVLILIWAVISVPQVSRQRGPHMFKRIFKWVSSCHKYRRSRKLSDHRATNLAVRLTITGSLAPSRAVPSYTKKLKRSIA